MRTVNNGINVVNRADYFAKPLSNEQIAELMSGDTAAMMLEPVTIEEIEHTYLLDAVTVPELLLSAITTKRQRLDKTMKAFVKSMRAAMNGTDITAGVQLTDLEDGGTKQTLIDPIISKPRKAGLVAVITALIPFNDGQSVSVLFYAPDDDPLKITNDDTLIAFRFLLNKRDITHIVSPNNGRDISLKQTTMALANAVEKNHAKFTANKAKANEEKAALEEKQETLRSLTDGVADIEGKVTKIQAEVKSSDDEAATYDKRLTKQRRVVVDLESELEGIKAKKLAEQPPVDLAKQILTIGKELVSLRDNAADGERVQMPNTVKDQLKKLKIAAKSASEYTKADTLGYAIASRFVDTALVELANGGLLPASMLEKVESDQPTNKDAAMRAVREAMEELFMFGVAVDGLTNIDPTEYSYSDDTQRAFAHREFNIEAGGSYKLEMMSAGEMTETSVIDNRTNKTAISFFDWKQSGGSLDDMVRLLKQYEAAEEATNTPASSSNTVPLSSVKTDSLLNPAIKVAATDTRSFNRIWYSQGEPKTIAVSGLNTPEEIARVHAYRDTIKAAKAKGFKLDRYNHSRLQGIYILVNDNEEVLTQKGFDALAQELPSEPKGEKEPEQGKAATAAAKAKVGKLLTAEKGAADELQKAESEFESNSYKYFDDYGKIINKAAHKAATSNINKLEKAQVRADGKIEAEFEKWFAKYNKEDWDATVEQFQGHLETYSWDELAEELELDKPAEEGEGKVLTGNFGEAAFQKALAIRDRETIEHLRIAGYDFGLDETTGYWMSKPDGSRQDYGTMYNNFILPVNEELKKLLATDLADVNTNPPNQAAREFNEWDVPTKPTNGNSFNKLNRESLDDGDYVINYGDKDVITVRRTNEGIEVSVSVDSGLYTDNAVYKSISDTKRFGVDLYNQAKSDHTSNLFNNAYTQALLDRANGKNVAAIGGNEPEKASEPEPKPTPSIADEIDALEADFFAMPARQRMYDKPLQARLKKLVDDVKAADGNWYKVMKQLDSSYESDQRDAFAEAREVLIQQAGANEPEPTYDTRALSAHLGTLKAIAAGEVPIDPANEQLKTISAFLAENDLLDEHGAELEAAVSAIAGTIKEQYEELV